MLVTYRLAWFVITNLAGYTNRLTMECCSTQCHGQSSMYLVLGQQQLCYVSQVNMVNQCGLWCSWVTHNLSETETRH